MDDGSRSLDSPGPGDDGQPGSRTLTPAQLMERLQVSENVLYFQLKHGALAGIAFRIGRQWRVSEAALERLMAGGE